MGGVGISSTPSLQQSSDLEKTQAELRQTFPTAEKFRRELEFLQKGGDPLDLKPGNETSISLQSTSLKQHHEQFVTRYVLRTHHATRITQQDFEQIAMARITQFKTKTASPHGDSVESSGRLGAPSVCEPNSADNLMLLKESGHSAVLKLPKKSYKRRIRSRPNRDPIRHASRDYKGLTHDVLKNSTSHLENELDGLPIKSDGGEAPATLDSIEPESLKGTDQVRLKDSKGPTKGNTEEIKSIPGPTKILDSESSCTQTAHQVDDYSGNGLHGTKPLEQNLGSNDLGAEKNDNILNSVVGPTSISQDGNANDTPSTLGVNHSTDGKEQNTCSQDRLKLGTKEHEDSILEEARIIEAKRKRIAQLSVRSLPLEKRIKSHWDFVLEEMSWLANDFAQERLWKLTAAAQFSRRVALASCVRFQQQSALQKQKELSHTLAEAVMQFWDMMQVKYKGLKSPCFEKDHADGIQGYAMRFMEYNNSSQVQCNACQAHVTLDIISDLGVLDHSWEDNLTEENLFYTVPPGAIEAYRKAVDAHLSQFERTGISMQEEVDTSCYDTVADNDAFEEDEGETNTYYMAGGLQASKSTKAAQKRRQNFKLYGPRSYATGDDVPFMQSVPSGKRSGSNLNATIPTKRVRTAPRQRIISPYNAGASGHMHATNRTDASSADTNSFQDEHSSLHGGAQIPNNLEAESVGYYEKQSQFDSGEVSTRPKKKKKEKHPGSSFEHRWQLGSNFQNDQNNYSRRRLDTPQFDSNGSGVASQMSNMSNPNKFMKLLARDRGRKVKTLKTPVAQPGSGSPWSLFEDQALVVLVHDMGPNWELISDALNSILQFKCIFRKSKECKTRHKMLMDMNNADGADSAEDSGSSQPYPSTLPGIPEGSARQLFLRLQGPEEDDTLKFHFEKIIMIGQKQHYRNRTQNDNQGRKQWQEPHSSHAFALSQVCPNNLSGGPVLTPLELSEAISSSPDVPPVSYQGLHSGGLPALNHGSVPPMLPGLGSAPGSTSASGSSNLVHGCNFPSASAPLNPSVREGRYGIPRTGSLSVEDQQRMQPYGQMLSARNPQQTSLPPGSHSVNDRGARMLPAGNGMGVMSAVNRNVKMTRPGFQGIASPSMLSPGSSAAPTGNPMLRPRDPTHMIRANQNTDPKVPQTGTTQPQSPHMFNSTNSFHPHHFQGSPNLHANPAYAMRLAKERQVQQQRLMQQQQFSTSNPTVPRVQPQDPQLPVASSPQNNAPLSSPPSVSISPSVAPKHPGPARNTHTSGNQLGKQQRPHPHQHAKLLKGGQEASLTNGFSQSGPNVNSSSQPKTFSGQTQAGLLKKPFDSSNSKSQPHGPPVAAGSPNHQFLNQKLSSQKQATQKLLLLKRKVNTSNQTTSKQTQSATAVTTIPKTANSDAENEPSGPPTNQPISPNKIDHDVHEQQHHHQQPLS